MGFPTWTLWGMGLSFLFALAMTAVALLAQSPRSLARLGLTGARLDLRMPMWNGLTFAALLLGLGFFLAGVPLDGTGGDDTAVATGPNVIQTATAAAAALLPNTPVVAGTIDPVGDETPTPGTRTSASGAFGAGASATPTSDTAVTDDTLPAVTPENTAVVAAATNTPPPNTTPTATSTAPPTPTATPTTTPSPTVTPTPIDGETAVISTQGSTLWVRRSPGGQELSLVRDGDVVILQNGRASQGGLLWREIRMVDGTLGWVQENFLNLGSATATPPPPSP